MKLDTVRTIYKTDSGYMVECLDENYFGTVASTLYEASSIDDFKEQMKKYLAVPYRIYEAHEVFNNSEL